MSKTNVLSGLILALLVFSGALAQDAPRRIAEPERAFAGHDRAHWVGRRVYFLPAGKTPEEQATQLSRDLRRWQTTHPTVGELSGRSATILEAWYAGSRKRRFDGRDVVTPDLYWKLQLEGGGGVLWFKDDGVGMPHSLGFWEHLLAARQWVGDTLWVKSERYLAVEGDQAVVELSNLEPVQLVEVGWGEFGNYPLKFALRTADGRCGYLAVPDTADFRDRWHWSDPRRRHPEWDEKAWGAIAERRLTVGMTPEMVRLSWGEPDSSATDRGVSLWFYQGVNKRRYTLKLVGGRLAGVIF